MLKSVVDVLNDDVNDADVCGVQFLKITIYLSKIDFTMYYIIICLTMIRLKRKVALFVSIFSVTLAK